MPRRSGAKRSTNISAGDRGMPKHKLNHDLLLAWLTPVAVAGLLSSCGGGDRAPAGGSDTAAGGAPATPAPAADTQAAGGTKAPGDTQAPAGTGGDAGGAAAGGG